ncbi:MAG: glycosyltransferase family 2 protein [Fimbriimonadaceae bacterium]
MVRPAFSVVIPTCNRPGSLARCLAALAPGVQTTAPSTYEVIVTDDGTDDGAARLVAESFPWARWSAGPRRGPAANRNAGSGLARGDWIAFADDDCVPSPAWLQGFAEALDGMHRVYEGRTTCSDWVESPRYEAPINLDGGWLWSCNMLIERAFFERLGGFDESYPYPAMEDVDLRERIREAGEDFPFVPAATVDHPKRVRAGGRTKGRYKECELLFAVKHGRRIGLWSTLIWPSLRIHVRSWRRSTAPLDTLPSAWNALIEVMYVATHYYGWRRKHLTRG